MQFDPLREAFQNAVAAFHSGRFVEAERYVKQLLHSRPGLLPALNLQAALAASQGHYKVAEKVLRKVIRDDPTNADARCNLGNVLKMLGRLQDAERSYRDSLAIRPGSISALNGLGAVLEERGQFDIAEDAYGSALRANPSDTSTLNNIGTLKRKVGRLAEAEKYLRAAISNDQANARALSNLGNVLSDMGRFSEAEPLLRRAVQSAPNDRAIYWNLAIFLSHHGNLAEAIELVAGAVTTAVENVEYLSVLVQLRQKACDWPALESESRDLLQHLTAHKGASAWPFALLCLPNATRQHQYLAATGFAAKKMGSLLETPQLVQAGSVRRTDRIRVGYLSADLHHHATSQLLVETIELHDRNQIECIAYSYGPDDGSDLCRRIRRAFDVLVDVRDLGHEEAARKIADDGIDILVDLKGYTQDSRLPILALRPAPIQVNWLGYPGTYGYRRLADYIIGDAVITPLEHADGYAEKIAQLPVCYQPNDRKRQIAPRPTRRDVGLPDNAFVFCSFNQAYKLTGEVFALWCRLLSEIPKSVLWLLEPREPVARASLLRAAGKSNIDPNRIVLAPSIQNHLHLARLQLADLALDTFPYTSHTTGSDALWAGVPMVTRIGDTFASRVAASLLNAIGLSELVARDFDEYYRLCRALASHPERLAAIKDALRRDRDTAPLFDSTRFVRDLERLYMRMIHNHEAGRLDHLPALAS